MEEYYNDFQADTQDVQDQDGDQQFQYDFPTQVSRQMTQDIVAIVSTCFKENLLNTHNSHLLTSHSRSTKRMMVTTICSL